jgi:7-carboxy-7-deazaguanine synthase
MKVAEIVAQVAGYSCRHVVVTGGEPMIAKEMPVLLARLRDAGHHLTIETAATVPPPDTLCCDLASLSPKLANSTPSAADAGSAWAQRHESRRLQPAVIRQWIQHFDCQIKFVVREESDVSEIQSLLATVTAGGDQMPALHIPLENILLMPEGKDESTLAARGRWLVDICKATGYRFCPRVHVHLFGHTRGT